MPSKKLKIYADGGSRGNPGPAATGFVITDEQDQILEEGGSYLGITTNNQAEYRAIILALEKAKSYQPEQVVVYMDSQLVINQLNGQYKIKSPGLKPLAEQAKAIATQFKSVTFQHVYRSLNALADKQVNLILDQNQ